MPTNAKKIRIGGVSHDIEDTQARSDISALKSSVDELDGSEHVYSYSIIKNEYVTTTGAFESYTGWDRTDYIELIGTDLKVYSQASANPYNCFYDANKNFISNFQTKTADTIDVNVPSNAKYVVLSAGAGLTWVLISGKDGKISILEKSIGFENVVTSNNQIDPSDAIGKTFGSVNDSVYLFPFGKTLSEIGSGYTNFKVYLNSESISGYFQLVKEDGTTVNGNYSFNTTTYNLNNVVNPNLVRGIKIHCYSAASEIVITAFGMTFNGLAVDTFETGNTSNVNPSSWSGKKWVAYGDSITYGGLWERIVVKRTGLLLTNAGLASSCVADVATSTVASFTDSTRISALPTDADVITIMGGTNDYGSDVPIGDIPTTTPYDKTTFIGALCETIKLIQTQCPTALIVIMSNIGGRGTAGVSGEIPPRNTIGLASSDYALAAEKVADFMGVPFIDVHRCGINPINRTLYIEDSVHPNEAGVKLIARKVIDYFVNNYPI